jgi:hypothetical protein
VSLLYDTLDGYTTCGDRVFHVQDMTTGATATWVSVVRDADLTPAEVISIGPLGHSFLIRISNDDDSSVGTRTFTITMSFANYPLSGDATNTVFSDTFDVTVSAATCECGLITWNSPTLVTISTSINVATVTDGLIEVGPDLGTQVLTAGARACGAGAASCDYTYTVEAFYGTEGTSLTALPAWMSYTRPNLSVTPLTTSEMGSHSVSIKQTRSSNGVITYYEAAIVNVGCIVSSYTPPTVPTLTDATYTIFDPLKKITLAPAF